MSAASVRISILFFALLIIVLSAIAAYWQERKQGFSHEASLKSASMIVSLLLCTSIVDVSAGFAKYI